ncbi:hypothetical protein CBR_g8792 [Chara braunii]|uniref:CCHC-type domain-containing protein n=1 Tax=Chara braunii TaxID=69332 RepID=A0A388KN57_CHABU|nr:hypothetical protein CBR_g8792 [Chara braunii]|eukprot:GBG71373.1 hypothetical protein CBR_g8792 [Chara braunii]
MANNNFGNGGFGNGNNNNNGNGNGFGNGGGGNSGGSNNERTCYNCGKFGHIARDCWAKRGRPNGDSELEGMKDFYRDFMRQRAEEEEKRKKEEERKRREEEDRRRMEEITRSTNEMRAQMEADLRRRWQHQQEDMQSEAEAFRAKMCSSLAVVTTPSSKKETTDDSVRKLLAAILRTTAARTEVDKGKTPALTGSPPRRAFFIGESSSAANRRRRVSLDESHVREERKRNPTPIQAETRECQQPIRQRRGDVATARRKPTPALASRSKRTTEGGDRDTPRRSRRVTANRSESPITPEKKIPAGCSKEGMVEYALSVHRSLSNKKVDVIKKLCRKNGVRYTKKNETVDELVRVHTRLAYDGFEEAKSPDFVLETDREEESGETDDAKEKVASTPRRSPRNAKTAGTFSKKKTRNGLCITIHRAFRKKTGTSIRSRITVKVKYDSIVSLKKVREALATVIRENNNLGRSVADILIARSRVIWEKNKTVGQLIHNQRSCLLRGYDQVCRCELFPDTPKINGHVLCRVSELKAAPGFVKNSKNVTAPHQDSSRQADITKGIQGAVNTRWTNCSINMERFNYLQKAGTKSAAMTTTEVRAWAAEFSQLVFVPVDRNNRETLLLCPTTYVHAFKMTFNLNPSLETIQQEEAAVVKQLKVEFREQKLEKRGAPVAGLGDRIASKHFNLNSMAQLPTALQKTGRQFRKAAAAEVHGQCFDVKEMFSRLNHGAIREGVDWLIGEHEERGIKQVKVSVRGKIYKFGRDRKKEEGFISISMDVMREAVVFLLKTSFSVCITEVKSQIFGIPMGKPVSPILACITCAYGEYKFMRSLEKDRCLVAGIRMMDDASIFVAEDPKSRDPRGKAAVILARFQDTYHEDLTLVRKDEGQNAWDFIGGTVMVCTNPAQVLFWPSDRNMTLLAKEGNLKVQGVQDFSSYTPKQVKKNTVYGMIKRCVDLATMEILVILALFAIYHEILLREYPSEVFLGCLAKLARLKASNGLLEVARVAAATWGVTLHDGSHKHGRG